MTTVGHTPDLVDLEGETLTARQHPLTGRVAVVTGAARGIGAACARALSAAGATVALLDRDAAAAEDLAAELTREQGLAGNAAAASGHGVDVTDWQALSGVIDTLAAEHGRLDIVVANAGMGDYSSLSTGDPDRWRKVVDTNLMGVLHTVRACLPHQVEQGSGDIVLMASIAGRQTWVGEPVYIATKWAVVGLGWALRKEVLDHGIRVSMIEPGMVDTPLVHSTEEGRQELASYAALSAEDVADAVLFACTRPAGTAVSEIVIQPLGPEL